MHGQMQDFRRWITCSPAFCEVGSPAGSDSLSRSSLGWQDQDCLQLPLSACWLLAKKSLRLCVRDPGCKPRSSSEERGGERYRRRSLLRAALSIACEPRSPYSPPSELDVGGANEEFQSLGALGLDSSRLPADCWTVTIVRVHFPPCVCPQNEIDIVGPRGFDILFFGMLCNAFARIPMQVYLQRFRVLHSVFRCRQRCAAKDHAA